MNILMVDQFGETGGAQKCLLDLISAWPCGDVVVVAAPKVGRLLSAAREHGCTTAAIPCGPYRAGSKGMLDALRFVGDTLRQYTTLRRIIHEHAIDMVYVNGPRVLAGAVLAAGENRPVIFHAHNRLERRPDIFMVRSALRRKTSTVIACCEYVAEPLPFAAPLVIRNGVPDAGYRRRQYSPDGLWRIGMVGRLSPEKGHAVLFDAVRSLVDEGHTIALTVAGASMFSSSGGEAELRRRAEGLGVQFTGWIDDVGSFLGGLDLLAVPSIAEPGLPRVVLEAFSAGVPVVALPSGGIPEAVRDNITGFLSADLTPASLAARIRAVMQSPPADISRVIHNARAEWESYWNVDRWRREVISAIRVTAREPEPPYDSLAASATSSGGHPERSA